MTGAVRVEGSSVVMSGDKRHIEGQVVELWTSVDQCGFPLRVEGRLCGVVSHWGGGKTL